MRKYIVSALVLLLAVPAFGKSKTEEVVHKFNKKGTNKIKKHDHIDLTDKTVLVLEGKVEMWKMEDLSQHLRDNNKGEIHLVINSPGGSVAAGLKFINEVESLRNQGDLKGLYCYIQDMAASMAAVIASYCDGVLIHKFGFFMIHEASYGCSGSQAQIKECVRFSENWLEQIFKDVAGNYGISSKELKEFQGAERYMTVDEVIGYGFVEALYETIYHNGYKPSPPKGGGLRFFFHAEDKDINFILERHDIDYRSLSQP